MEQFIHQIDGLVRADWLNTAISVVVILGITAIVARLLTRFLRRVLHFNEQKDLPSSSIFVNIARAAVWVTGICIMLSTSFNVNVSAAITALGIGGIAISLGFQDTLSNLIGGLQLSLLRIIKPGDNITVGSESGVVRDVTWRHTTIKNSAGEEIIIPNSIINKTALVQLPPPNQTGLPVVVTTNGEDLTRTASAIEKAADEAASAVGKVKKKPEAHVLGDHRDRFQRLAGLHHGRCAQRLESQGRGAACHRPAHPPVGSRGSRGSQARREAGPGIRHASFPAGEGAWASSGIGRGRDACGQQACRVRETEGTCQARLKARRGHHGHAGRTG